MVVDVVNLTDVATCLFVFSPHFVDYMPHCSDMSSLIAISCSRVGQYVCVFLIIAVHKDVFFGFSPF